MAKKKTSKPKKTNNTSLSEEYLDKYVRVTEEQTRAFVEKHIKYTIHPRPTDVKKKAKNKLWCCYCNDWKKFTNSRKTNLNYPRCETCNISTEDSYIKTHNGLWDKIK